MSINKKIYEMYGESGLLSPKKTYRQDNVPKFSVDVYMESCVAIANHKYKTKYEALKYRSMELKGMGENYTIPFSEGYTTKLIKAAIAKLTGTLKIIKNKINDILNKIKKKLTGPNYIMNPKAYELYKKEMPGVLAKMEQFYKLSDTKPLFDGKIDMKTYLRGLFKQSTTTQSALRQTVTGLEEISGGGKKNPSKREIEKGTDIIAELITTDERKINAYANAILDNLSKSIYFVANNITDVPKQNRISGQIMDLADDIAETRETCNLLLYALFENVIPEPTNESTK